MLAIIFTGIVATAIMSIVMKMAPKMGLPEMDIPKVLSGMMGNNITMGWMMHFITGIILTFIYAKYGFAATITGAILYGAIHWLVVGIVMGMMPGMDVGYWMTKNGGSMAFVGGLIGHIIFALSIYFLLPLF